VLIKEMQSLGLDVRVHKRATLDADVEAIERFTAGA
jgi:DNA-directed RNA polymerase subunit beta